MAEIGHQTCARSQLADLKGRRGQRSCASQPTNGLRSRGGLAGEPRNALRSLPLVVRRRAMTAAAQEPKKILVVDVGGTHVKVRVTGQREERKIPSGPAM